MPSRPENGLDQPSPTWLGAAQPSCLHWVRWDWKMTHLKHWVWCGSYFSWYAHILTRSRMGQATDDRIQPTTLNWEAHEFEISNPSITYPITLFQSVLRPLGLRVQKTLFVGWRINWVWTIPVLRTLVVAFHANTFYLLLVLLLGIERILYLSWIGLNQDPTLLDQISTAPSSVWLFIDTTRLEWCDELL